MEKLNRLFILVQNPEHELIEEKDLDVEGRSDPEEDFQKIPYHKQFFRYILENITPGKYQIRVKGPSEFKTEIRDLELSYGDNHVHIMLGKPDMLSFRMAGMNYYFEPHPEELILSVQGAKNVSQVTNVLERGKLRYEIIPDYNKRIIPDALLIKILIGKGEEAEKTRNQLYKIIKERFSKLKTILAAPIYKKNQINSGITNEVVIRFKESIEKQDVENFVKKYNLNVIRTLPYIKHGFLTRLEGSPDYKILDIIRAIEDSNIVEYAQPNLLQLIQNFQYPPDDFLYHELPHLEHIDCHAAWQRLPRGISGGNPDIIIAILDSDGVDPSHPDLNGELSDGREKIIANWDFVNRKKQKSNRIPGNHGTECAGSATAIINNGIGISGVAPNCHLIGGRLAAITHSDIADIWTWMAGFPYPPNPRSPAQLARGADVISNSWAFRGPNTISNVLVDVFNFLTTEGRGGNGCILCFAIGNYGHILVDNYNPLSADERTIGIGSSINVNPTSPCNSDQPDHNGNQNNLHPVVDTRSYFSPYGMTIDLVSPSHTCYELNTGRRIDPILACSRCGTGNWPGINEAHTTIAQPITQERGLSRVELRVKRFRRGDIVLFDHPNNDPNEIREIVDVDHNIIFVDILDNNYDPGTPVISGPIDYVYDFGGTSHSCPTVAGAAALILSVSPNLSWQEVRDCLRNSADRIDNAQTHPIGQWFHNGIREYSQWYGYGRLNVNNAIP